jgi:hypothetical protein
MLEVRNGPIEITPTLDGPLMVRGNIEIISGAGRVMARQQTTRFVPVRTLQHEVVLRRLACEGRL